MGFARAWHSPGSAGVRAAGLDWHVGWQQEGLRVTGLRRGVVTASDGDAELARWDVGVGRIVATGATATGLAVCVSREEPTLHGLPPAAEVLAFRADRDEPATLLAPDAVDISERCWPLVPRPVAERSFLAGVLDTAGDLAHWWHGDHGVEPLSDGLSDCVTDLVGDWPDTRLWWTFSHRRYPGVRLRRSVPLFDELGRPSEPGLAEVHLMEDVDTGLVPSLDHAADGVLDI